MTSDDGASAAHVRSDGRSLFELITRHREWIHKHVDVLTGGMTDSIGVAIEAVVMESTPHRMHSRLSLLEAALRTERVADTRQQQILLAVASDLAHRFWFAVLLPTSYVGVRTVASWPRPRMCLARSQTGRSRVRVVRWISRLR